MFKKFCSSPYLALIMLEMANEGSHMISILFSAIYVVVVSEKNPEMAFIGCTFVFLPTQHFVVPFSAFVCKLINSLVN